MVMSHETHEGIEEKTRKEGLITLDLKEEGRSFADCCGRAVAPSVLPSFSLLIWFGWVRLSYFFISF